MTTLLDERELGTFIDTHYKAAGDRLFRMERLPRYDVPHQFAELERWLAGEVEPNWETKQPWLDTLAAEQRRGLVSQRVRVFGAQLSADELRACHWDTRSTVATRTSVCSTKANTTSHPA
jgi:hypothetical protein